LKVPLSNLPEVLKKFLASPNLASREWVYQQYDHMVRTNTAQLPSADAAVVRIKGTQKALAMSLDGNGRYCMRDPKRGAQIAVAESCRNLVCAGALPLAATNCLNFGNPQKPEIMWQFSEVIDGMADACRVFDTPVTGGNVSFYNETLGEGIYPTPVIGMVGLIDPVSRMVGSWFKQDGHLVALLGPLAETSGEYPSAVENTFNEWSQNLANHWDPYTFWANELPCPPIDLAEERRIQKACLEGIHSGCILSAHDCSDGGLAVALAEMSFSHFRSPARGCDIELPGQRSPEVLLFGEFQSRILVTLEGASLEDLKALCRRHRVEFLVLGRIGGDRLRIRTGSQTWIDEPVATLEGCWKPVLDHWFQSLV
jgi:phosphoribosylformylglycinamidine synthase